MHIFNPSMFYALTSETLLDRDSLRRSCGDLTIDVWKVLVWNSVLWNKCAFKLKFWKGFWKNSKIKCYWMFFSSWLQNQCKNTPPAKQGGRKLSNSCTSDIFPKASSKHDTRMLFVDYRGGGTIFSQTWDTLWALGHQHPLHPHGIDTGKPTNKLNLLHVFCPSRGICSVLLTN